MHLGRVGPRTHVWENHNPQRIASRKVYNDTRSRISRWPGIRAWSAPVKRAAPEGIKKNAQYKSVNKPSFYRARAPARTVLSSGLAVRLGRGEKEDPWPLVARRRQHCQRSWLRPRADYRLPAPAASPMSGQSVTASRAERAQRAVAVFTLFIFLKSCFVQSPLTSSVKQTICRVQVYYKQNQNAPKQRRSALFYIYSWFLICRKIHF